MSGGSSRGREKGKGTTIVWEGSLGPDFFKEALYERFSVESKSDFTKETPLRGYNERKEDWPKCMHGEDCLVQMFTEKIDDIQASSLQEGCVPVVVLHVQEPIVGSRMKERKVLHGIKHSLPLLHRHMYAKGTNLLFAS